MPGPLLMNVRHQLSRRSPSFGSECATGRAAGDVRASAPGRHRARGRRLVAQAPSKRSASCVPVRARPRERYALLATCGDHELCAPSVEQVEVDVEGRVRQVLRDWIRTRSHLKGRGPGTRRVRSVMVYHRTLCALRALRTPGLQRKGCVERASCSRARAWCPPFSSETAPVRFRVACPACGASRSRGPILAGASRPTLPGRGGPPFRGTAFPNPPSGLAPADALPHPHTHRSRA